MPKIMFGDATITCTIGTNLRQVFLDNNLDLYNGKAKIINCHGLGTCGTCAVGIQGEVAPPSWRETTRLSLPPHRSESEKRLACQVKVKGDLVVTKYEGFWGEKDTPVT